MINPVIVEQSGTTETGWEGCFSVPGLMGLVPRAEDITVEYTSADGKDVTEHYSGYVASNSTRDRPPGRRRVH
jgi:peptide deformylase